MGLDVNLHRLTTFDTDKLVAYNARSRSSWRRSLHYLLRGNSPTQRHLSASEKLNAQAVGWNSYVASSLGLPSDVELRVMEQEEPIELPSTKHPPYSIGYIRSGYGGGGINTVLRAVIGTDLYYAFPEASETGGYIKPNWRRSQQRLQKMLTRFEAKGSCDAKFNAAISVNMESAQNLIAWLNPNDLRGSKAANDFTVSMAPAEQFQDYMHQLGAVLETVNYVLGRSDANNYVFYWST